MSGSTGDSVMDLNGPNEAATSPDLPSTPPFHPEFDDPTTDIVLVSSDSVKFRVHSVVLHAWSGVFKDMLSLPRTPGEDGVVPVSESSATLTPLLQMMCGVGFHQATGTTGENLEMVALAARKYEMPGVLSYIRLFLLWSSDTKLSPIRKYALAAAAGLEEVTSAMLVETLDVDVRLTEYQTELAKLDGEALLALFAPRWKRSSHMDAFFGAKWGDPRFNSLRTCSTSCGALGRTIIAVAPDRPSSTSWKFCYNWRNLQCRVKQEIESRPSGRAFRDRSFEDWEECKAFDPAISLPCDWCDHESKFTRDSIMLAVRQAALTLPSAM